MTITRAQKERKAKIKKAVLWIVLSAFIMIALPFLAVKLVLKDGVRTPDIWSEGCTKVGTKEMGQEIIRRI